MIIRQVRVFFILQIKIGFNCFVKYHTILLKELLAQSPPDILQCGLHPTFDQIEMYAYHLPQASLANLIDIFASLSVIDDSLYSLCQMEDFKFLADMIEHIKLPLKAKYTFCCAPINRKMPLVCTMFMKIVRQYRYASFFFSCVNTRGATENRQSFELGKSG